MKKDLDSIDKAETKVCAPRRCCSPPCLSVCCSPSCLPPCCSVILLFFTLFSRSLFFLCFFCLCTCSSHSLSSREREHAHTHTYYVHILESASGRTHTITNTHTHTHTHTLSLSHTHTTCMSQAVQEDATQASAGKAEALHAHTNADRPRELFVSNKMRLTDLSQDSFRTNSHSRTMTELLQWPPLSQPSSVLRWQDGACGYLTMVCVCVCLRRRSTRVCVCVCVCV